MPTFRKTGRWECLIPEIGYFRPLKSLTAESNVPTGDLCIEKTGEKPRRLQAALYARLQRRGANWGVSTGLHYSRLSERMNLEYSYIKEIPPRHYFHHGITNGDTIHHYIRGYYITGVEGYRYHPSPLQLKYFWHPLLFYEKILKSWAIGAEAGVYFNLALASRGKIPICQWFYRCEIGCCLQNPHWG